MLIGGCLCGSVRYEVEGEPAAFYHCHCKRCRRSTGTGHASNVMVKHGTLTFTAGEQFLKLYKVPEAKRFSRQFCSHCGSIVAREVPELEAVIIPAGSLDIEPSIRPQARIFWNSRAQWSCSDDLPRYPESLF